MRSAAVQNLSEQPFSLAVNKNIIILVWKKQPHLAGVTALQEALKKVSQGHPDRKIGFLTIIEPDSIGSSPDSEIRKSTAALLQQYDARLGAAAVLYEPSGLKATIIRSIISTINLASRASFPNAVMNSATEACTWMEKKLGEHSLLTASGIQRLANSARA